MELKMQPEVITKLVHLQFLRLFDCPKLKELPRDFKRLVNLRNLYVPESLKYMPLGMGEMTSLTKLDRFVVGHRKSCMKQEDNLEGLRGLRNLKRSLDIEFKEGYKHAKEYCGKGGYICETQHLNSIYLIWDHETNEERVGNDEDLLEDLQPHRNLKELAIWYYHGVRIPRWAREDSLTTSLPNLVYIKLESCFGLEELPWLGRLKHLKTLWLNKLENVEYMENRSGDDGVVASNSSMSVESSTALFFPSLETLYMYKMPKLKGWWRGMSNCTSGTGSGLGIGENEIVNRDSSMVTPPAHLLPSFPHLSELHIENCPNLRSFPLYPCAETLNLYGLNERFERIITRPDEEEMGVGRSKNITTDSLLYLKSLPMLAFPCVVKMNIHDVHTMESLSEVKEVLRGCSSTLRSLKLESCYKLRSVSEGGGLEYFTSLERLQLRNLSELRFEETDMPWRSLAKCLLRLNLLNLNEVVSLPKGMRYLTFLQSLYINEVPLKEIPEWIECLSSLQSFIISSCKNLETLPKGMRYLTSLKSLDISYLPLLKEIPEWIECLSSLQSLIIGECRSLESLPREMKNLTSLNRLDLINCSEELKHRCEKPDGEYCPILEHIPHLKIEDVYYY